MTYNERKNRAFKLIREDNYLKAIDEFSKLYYENPKDSEVLKASLFLFSRIVQGNYDFEPITAEQFGFRGVSKFYMGEIEASVRDFNQALSLNPKMDYYLKCKAFSLRFLKKYDQSIVELEKAIAIRPHGEYFDDLAEVYSIIGDNGKALLNHEKAVKYSPEDPRLWYNYGTYLGQRKHYEKAIEMLDKALELFPLYEDALHNRKYYLSCLKK
jgi:tetratricopeptide (TPR) repeat protein